MSPWQPFTALQDPTLSFSPCLIRPPHHLQRLNGIKYWWWCFAPRPYSPPFCSLCLWSPSSLSFSLPLVMLISLVFLLLPAHCTVMHFMMTLPHLSPHYSLFFSFHISFIYPGSVFNCRQRGNLWLQLAAGRVGTFPFASPGQQPSHPWCSWWYTSIAALLLSLALLLHCIFIPVSLRASPGLVAVGSTRASHTVTWHSIYRPSEGVALGARSMPS